MAQCTMASTCTKHGRCQGDGSCQCFDGWSGEHCLTPDDGRTSPRFTTDEKASSTPEKPSRIPGSALPVGAEQCSDGTCKSPAGRGGDSGGVVLGSRGGFPADVPVPPLLSSTLQMPRSAIGVDRRPEVVAERCTLHVPHGAVFRHGETLGMVAVARDRLGAAVQARGLSYEINVTGVGDGNSGTVYDLQNGTSLIYSTVYFSPAIALETGAEVWVRLGGAHIAGSPFPIAFDMGKNV